MMTLYVNPYRRMNQLRQAMDRLFEENFSEASSEREMALAVDVRGDEDTFTIRALVPGLDPEAVNIEILNNTVTIRGEFKAMEDDQAKFLMNELPTGRFCRVLTLPTALDAAKSEATIKDGVLTLRVSKAEAHRPKAIKVSTN